MENIFVNEYERRAHSVGISIWHFEWCSKYRYKAFGKFAASVGFVQRDVITEYVRNQKEHHLGNRTL